MTPVSADCIRSLDSLPLVRFMGPDGGWRSGRLVRCPECQVVIIDVRRNEVAVLDEWYDEYEPDGPRDDAGNLLEA